VASTTKEELDIIRGCIRKDEKSQEMLYKKFFGYALSVAMIYNNQRSDALEVVDDGFMKVFSEIEKFDISQPFKRWLRRIIINTSIDRLRRKHKNIFLSETESLQIQDNSPTIISHISAGDILILLNRLPHIHKVVFSLYEIEGFDHSEIAEKLSIPESSSRVYLTRAKKQLRELFQIYFIINQKQYGN
jgi:RNA polymerase sigma factor (sigma-70 family)